MAKYKRIQLKQTNGGEAATSSRAYYPSLYIENRALPLGKTDIGDKLEARVVLKLKGISTDSEKKNTYTFDVLNITF